MCICIRTFSYFPLIYEYSVFYPSFDFPGSSCVSGRSLNSYGRESVRSSQSSEDWLHLRSHDFRGLVALTIVMTE